MGVWDHMSYAQPFLDKRIPGLRGAGGGGSHLRTREAAYCQEKGSDRELPEAGQWGDLLGSFLSFYAFYLWF